MFPSSHVSLVACGGCLACCSCHRRTRRTCEGECLPVIVPSRGQRRKDEPEQDRKGEGGGASDWPASRESLRCGFPWQAIRCRTSVAGLPLQVFRCKCLNVTCVQCENGKSISPIDSAQPTIAHDADTDSDLARPPDGKHPSARQSTPAMLLRSATHRGTAGHIVARPGLSDSE
jgi:hypothetical protein